MTGDFPVLTKSVISNDMLNTTQASAYYHQLQ